MIRCALTTLATVLELLVILLLISVWAIVAAGYWLRSVYARTSWSALEQEKGRLENNRHGRVLEPNPHNAMSSGTDLGDAEVALESANPLYC